MSNLWLEIRVYLFIIPFLGIFSGRLGLLLGPYSGFQAYLVFAEISLAGIAALQTIFNSQICRVKPIDAVWFVFLLTVAINFWIINRTDSFLKFQGLLILAGLYWFFRRQNQSIVKKHNFRVSILFSLLSMAICIYGLLQYVNIYPSHSDYYPITSFFRNPAPLAAFLTVLFPYMALHLIETWNNKRTRCATIRMVIVFSSLLVSLAFIILVWSRAAWVALVIMVTVYYIIFNLEKNVKLWHVTVIVGVFIALIGGLYFIKPQSANGRLLRYLVSFHVWKQAPLFGVGWHNFGFYHNQFQELYFHHHPKALFPRLADDTVISYNVFIRIAVELGITGLAIFIGGLFVSLRNRGIKSRPMAAKAAWLSTIGILTVGIFSYPLSQPFVLALFVFNLSILAYCNKQVLFTIRNIKLKVTASVILLATFALLCRNVKIFRASLQWQNGYHIVSKNRQKGLEMYAEAYSTLKSYPAFLYNYGYELSMVVRYKKSLPMLQMARKNMYNQDLLLRTGFVQMKLHHYKKAEQNYLQAQYLIPSRLIPRYLLMLLYEDWPKPKESVQMANEIIDFKPKVSSEETLLLKNRAQVYLDSLRQN